MAIGPCRLSALLLLTATLVAVEAPPTPPTTTAGPPATEAPPGALFEFSAEGRVDFSLDQGTSSAEGGVTARYEGIALAAERVAWRQTPFPGTTVTCPQEVDLTASPATADRPAGRVVIDTRNATLPTIGFKGLLSPAAVAIRRQPPEAGRPGVVTYHVDLPDTGAFDGLMQTESGWAPFRGWASQAAFDLTGDLRSGTVADLRVTRIVLTGWPAAGDQPRRNAAITRLKPGAVPPLDQPVPTELIAGHLDAPQITLTFDALGRPSASFIGLSHFAGDQNFLNLRDLAPPKTP